MEIFEKCVECFVGEDVCWDEFKGRVCGSREVFVDVGFDFGRFVRIVV